MNINEVYAMNIQPRTIIKATDCKLEEVELERGKFLEWMNKVGKKFASQMDAWAVYVGLSFPLAQIKQIYSFEDMSNEEFEEMMYTHRAYLSVVRQ